ncbi:MAG: hypothetical protein MRK02_00510 [Candidatus Scalindua sp.]|nr:hypothetical protein [Candidatus Scalindua sp.]
MILFDLGLLEYLFKIFYEVAIAKNTILNLQMLAQQFFGSSHAIKAKSIFKLLSRHVDRINQPSSNTTIDENHIFYELDCIKSVYDSSIHIYYTDDAISRLYVCGDNHYKNTISTIDIITILRDYSLITKKEAAEKFAQLCAFNIMGTLIHYNDILIVLKDDLPEGESIKSYLERLNNHQKFKSFMNMIWWFKRDYKKALTEIGQFISLMISRSREDGVFIEQDIITAIWCFWYQKVQFTIKSEQSKLHFFARSFLFTAIELLKRIEPDHENKGIWGQLWSIYNDIVKFTYGEDMDRGIENKSKSLLAQMIYEFEFESNTKIFNFIASGLTAGTSESNFFQKAYAESSIMMRQKGDAK